MPATGKHRRPKSARLVRTIAITGTGGAAALALPLIGATQAQAATQSAPGLAPVTSVAVAAQAAPEAPAQQRAELTTYSVKVGDHLSKIADDQDLRGGWQRLYQDNRTAVGSNPDLITPGLKLTLGGKAAATATAPKPAAPKPAAPRAAEPKAAEPKAAEPKAAAPEATGPKAVQPEQAAPAAPAAPKPAAPKAVPVAAQAPAATASAGGYTLPVASGVGTPYRASGSMWSSGYHTGVDFSVPSGTPLKAVGPGTVVSAGWAGAYGNQVVIQLADGKYAQYAHLSQLGVSAGQSVSGGQQIGTAGSTGNSTGPHLHFEIRTSPAYGSDIDPLSYLRSKGVAI
ncbi:peptidoglycan DD-metalloendopeptidase family protein [Streptomyces sp. NPDC059578]|uniref:peptidoglycan DD-metalloendopeptidase family protein n=1 Tax=unclassified Streptomyces TaxID=2593676 RepID=UPI003662C92C